MPPDSAQRAVFCHARRTIARLLGNLLFTWALARPVLAGPRALCSSCELGDAVREAGDFPARRVAMDHALLGRAHDRGLGLFESVERLGTIAGGDRILDLADECAQPRAARLVDCSAPGDL